MVFTFELCSALCSSWFHFIWCITSSMSSKHGTHSQKKHPNSGQTLRQIFCMFFFGYDYISNALIEVTVAAGHRNVGCVLVRVWNAVHFSSKRNCNRLLALCFWFQCSSEFFFGFGLFAVPFFFIALPNPYMAPVHQTSNKWSNMCSKHLKLKMQSKLSTIGFVVVHCCAVCVCVCVSGCMLWLWMVCTCMCSRNGRFIPFSSRWNRNSTHEEERKKQQHRNKAFRCGCLTLCIVSYLIRNSFSSFNSFNASVNFLFSGCR